MDQLEEVFPKRWSVKEDPKMLLARIDDIKKLENKIVREFNSMFERLLQQIPKSYHPREYYLLFLYSKAFPG
jgi:hypothetical protein